MTILAIVTGEGMTKDMYESLRKEVNWEGNPPPGVIFHAASFDNSGNLRVADIWESEDHLNNFFKSRRYLLCRKVRCLRQRWKYFKSIT
jgi:hypothetical protein